MKTIHALATATLFMFTPVLVLHAQTSAIDRGSVLLDGDASFTSNTAGVNNDDRMTLLTVRPAVQYLILPGFAIGGVVSLAHSSLNGLSSTAFGVGPAVTYFFGKGERNFYPFVSGHLNLDRVIYSGDQDARNVFSYRGAGGVLLMLSRSVGLTGELFYRGQNSRGNSNSNSFGLAFGVSAFIF
jgi:hypothetical protein